MKLQDIILDKKNKLVYEILDTNENELKGILSDLMLSNGYRLSSDQNNILIYERGNRVLRILFGAFVTYHKQKFYIVPEGNKTELIFEKASSGMSGGLIGMNAVRKEFDKLKELLKNRLETESIGRNE